MDTTLLLASFVAGLLMFLSPCTLPLVPGYLAYIAGGLGVSNRKHVTLHAVVFVLGFSVVFLSLGVFAGTFGVLVSQWKPLIIKVAGLSIVILGLSMLNIFSLGFLSKERHIRLPSFLIRGKSITSFILGTLFALGWSPCIGPILASVLFVAAVSPTNGVVLLAAFSLGLGLPFILCAFFLDIISSHIARWAGFAKSLNMLAAVVLVCVGVAMFFDKIGKAASWFN